MTEPLWLSQELILVLHERLIAEFGGLPGCRDEGLLESALGKAKNLFAYGSPSEFDLASSYAFGIIRNHPFLDGNKRTGFAAAAVFLETNGIRLTATEVEATAATLALASGNLSQEGYAAWLKEQSEFVKRRKTTRAKSEREKREKRRP